MSAVQQESTHLNYLLRIHAQSLIYFSHHLAGPIEKKCVNTLLSEVLCMPPSLCRPLSNVVHSKTGGIILFVLRFLASLNDEGHLWFSMSSRRWMYNLEQIRLKEIHGDVVSHMTEVLFALYCLVCWKTQLLIISSSHIISFLINYLDYSI